MPTVYRVLPDVNNYQFVLAEDVKEVAKYSFDGTPLRESWVPPRVYTQFPNKPEGDFWGCFSSGGIFAVTPECANSIAGFLDQSCECLPLPCEGQKLQLCNVTHLVNCLDTERSKYDPNSPNLIYEYVFYPHRFVYSLFKIPQRSVADILCVEGRVAPHDEFKGCVEELGLKGLRFKKLWSDEL